MTNGNKTINFLHNGNKTIYFLHDGPLWCHLHHPKATNVSGKEVSLHEGEVGHSFAQKVSTLWKKNKTFPVIMIYVIRNTGP